jgi:hypothetical protein
MEAVAVAARLDRAEQPLGPRRLRQVPSTRLQPDGGQELWEELSEQILLWCQARTWLQRLAREHALDCEDRTIGFTGCEVLGRGVPPAPKVVDDTHQPPLVFERRRATGRQFDHQFLGSHCDRESALGLPLWRLAYELNAARPEYPSHLVQQTALASKVLRTGQVAPLYRCALF